MATTASDNSDGTSSQEVTSRLEALQALHAAVLSGHTFSAGEALQQLATSGEDMLALLESGVGEEGRSLLHLLAAQIPCDADVVAGCAATAVLLVEACANLNGESAMGETPLLLASRAAIEYEEQDVKEVELDSDTRLAIVSRLLEMGADPNLGNLNEETPLMEASCAGDFELCRLLLDFRAEVLPASRRGLTALDFAAGRSKVHALLTERSQTDVKAAEPSLPSIKVADVKAALVLPAVSQALVAPAAVAEAAEQKAAATNTIEVAAPDTHRTCALEAIDFAEEFAALDQGGVIPTSPPSSGQAAWALDELVSALEDGVTAASGGGPAIHAASRRASAAVRRIEAAINADIAGGEHEKDALLWPPMASLRGADIDTEEICGAALQSWNQSGKLLLQLCQTSLPDCHIGNAVRWLLTAKASPNMANERGDTALALAVRAVSRMPPDSEKLGCTDAIEALLQCGADPNIGNDSNEDVHLPLMDAVCAGDAELCALLFDAGARWLVQKDYQI